LWPIVRNRSDGLTTIIQFLDLLLKIAARTFEHRAVSGIAAAFELLNHVLQRQLEALFLSQSIRRFPCQARLFGHCSGGRLLLLRLDGFAFPASRHSDIIAFCESAFAGYDSWVSAIPIPKIRSGLFQKPISPRKIDLSLRCVIIMLSQLQPIGSVFF